MCATQVVKTKKGGGAIKASAPEWQLKNKKCSCIPKSVRACAGEEISLYVTFQQMKECVGIISGRNASLKQNFIKKRVCLKKISGNSNNNSPLKLRIPMCALVWCVCKVRTASTYIRNNGILFEQSDIVIL